MKTSPPFAPEHPHDGTAVDVHALSSQAAGHSSTSPAEAPRAEPVPFTSENSDGSDGAMSAESHWKLQYAEIATLAGGLAHEIRNPLSTIRLNLELLEEELAEEKSPQDRRNRQRVAKVLQECSHLDQLLSDFLQFARAHAPHRELISLNELVQEFLVFFAAQANESKVEISPHLSAHLPLVALDRRMFRQVLQNLTRNALQAMAQGGRLEILTLTVGNQVILELIDNGCGMSEQTQQRMFETFYSTKPGGSGLGLPTVRRIIEAHEGTIECQSKVGAGTRFRISLPAASPTGHDCT